MAKRRGRKVHGILLLNKPIGMTSNGVLQHVKRLFNAQKAGHTGSLDKLASGLLPICFGEATKFSSFLLEADKRYQAVCTLGRTTTTGDAEGETLETHSTEGINLDKITQVVQAFLGPIEQIPPMHSALKRQGQALYKLARQGQVVERLPRSITIYELTIQSLVDNQLTMEVHCSKGTYIRTLAEDMGKALGCGAYLSALHRTKVGHYQEMVDLTTLEQTLQQGQEEALDRLLIPMHNILTHYPQVTLSTDMTYYIRQGHPVQVAHAPTQGLVKLFSNNNNFLGIGEVLEDGRVAPKRLVCFN